MRSKKSVSSLRAAAGTLALASLMATALPAEAREPVSTAFTYQGELAATGAPAAGTFDIRFRLFDAASDGNQIGSTLCTNDLIIENGRFAVSLDFGAAFTGEKRFLEIEVRQDAGQDCSDESGYSALTPRREMTATPNASFAQTSATSLTANDAASLNGQSPSFYQNAANLTGTIADAQLSSNVARLDSNQTFTGLLNFANAGNTFAGNGAALTNLNGGNITAGTLVRSSLSADVRGGVGTVAPELSLTGSIATGSAPYSVAVSGSFAYVVNQASNTLQVFNISNSAAPTLAGSVATQSGGGPSSVAVSGLYAYVVNYNLNTLQIFNISNPAAITLVGGANTNFQPISVAVSGSFAYVVHQASNTLMVFNISNPATPSLRGSDSTGSQPHSVAASGSFAYVVNGGSNTLQVFSRSPLGEPTLVGSVATGTTPQSVTVSGSFAYVVNYNSNTLQVFNISNPAAPTLAGSVATQAGGGPISVAVSGSFAYVVNSNLNTLQIFNISDPAAITPLGSTATGNLPFSVAVSGSLACIANYGSNMLQVFNAAIGVGFGTPLAASSLAGVNGSGLTSVNATQLNGQPASFYTNASNISSGTVANARTTGNSTNTPFTLVIRDASGNFAAGTITAALNGNATTATSATTATNATQLNGQSASFYTNASNITTGALAAAQVPNLDTSKITSGTLDNARTSATSVSTPGTLVQRDASGNFAAGTITAALNGNAATATTASAATTASTATNATQLNGQPGSFYMDASNISAGTLSDARLSTRVALKNAANAFTSTGVTSFAGNIGVGTTTPNPQFSLHAVTTGDTQIALTGGPAVEVGAGPARTWTIQSSSVNNPVQTQVTGSFQIIDRTIGVSRLLIDTNGNVGIGTTTPSQRLTVAGNMNVTGTLAKAGGSFKIDHPLDPENKYLYHSFVESPDMMNIYNGNVTTDASGYATITMPDYFEALNRDFRYQLTVLDEGDTFTFAKVSRKIGVEGPRMFTIRTSSPHTEVSWQVTGIRHDAWAEKNRIPNSVDKVGAEKGKLLHPEAFSKPGA